MRILFMLLIIISSSVFGQKFLWKKIETKTDASFRGLSVVDDSVAWVSGSKGWVGRSTNGGKDWSFKQVVGFEKYDFRSLYAFNAQTAIIANVGSPAYILHTTDGGSNWKVVYTNENKDAFFDGVGFWNDKEGILYGDPMQGRMLLLRTDDGGLTWKEFAENNRPVLAEGEASFAASGTGIRCFDTKKIIIATGGKVSRLWISTDKGLNWNAMPTPMLQGQSSTGIFSFAFADEKSLTIVGGDFQRDSVKTDHVFYTQNGGKNWSAPITPTRGYRECVEYISKKTLLATGPRGTDISEDGGIHWLPLSDEKSFHVVRKARKGSLIILAGGEGKVSLLQAVK